jgi:uncharacterized protein YndB with AHSA1/START domain
MSAVDTEYGSIEREIHIEASPDIVYQVVSRPEYIQQWWDTQVTLADPTPGTVGELAFSDGTNPRAFVEPFTVVEADPPRRFAFRWIAEGEDPAPGNSLLVTFDIEATGSGSTLRMSETGFREKGWEAAVIEQTYNDHCQGWDGSIPRIGPCAERLAGER